jgi:hypothetical protein
MNAAERRAPAARLSAFLFAAALCWVVVAQASAAPLAPKLDETSPASTAASPAFSTTPSVLGEAEPEEVIRESMPVGVPSAFTSSRAAHPTKNANFEIVVFLGSECKGPVIGTGTAGAFESTGISLTVSENTKTVMSAVQFDPAKPGELSACSNALSYWEGSVPPEAGSGGNGEGGSGGDGEGGGGSDGGGGGNAGGQGGGGSNASNGSTPSIANGGAGGPSKPQAPHIHTNPGGVSSNTAPFIVGNTPAAETVLIYASEGCRGAPVARGSVDQLQSGFQIQVTPNVITTFSAAAIVGQRSACSDPVAYTEDSTAPRTRITMAPGIKTRKRKAIFRFKDITEDPPGTSFSCKVDKKKWKPCASPFRIKHLKFGHHMVKIRATDLAGNHERKPVKRRFIVIRRKAH